MNHSKHATCWWDVRGDLLSGSGCIEIRCCLWAFPTAGEELCIQYQDSANNTSLLLRYGFVEGHNQDDCVRVFIPWDQTISEGRKIKQRELLAVRAHTLCVKCVTLHSLSTPTGVKVRCVCSGWGAYKLVEIMSASGFPRKEKLQTQCQNQQKSCCMS